MKTILVPVDFSTNSRKALRYALLLAGKMKYRISLIHVFIDSIGIIANNSEKIRWDFAENELKKLAENIKTKTKVKCSSLLVRGVSANKIVEITEKKKAELIVMGTKGASGIKKIIIGSAASQIVKESKIPVLVVPEKTALKKIIRTIVFATDYHDSDLKAIKFLSVLAKTFSSKLTMVHVMDGELNNYSEQQLIDWFSSKVTKTINYSAINFRLVKSKKNIGEALQSFIKRSKADIIAVSIREKDIAEKLFTPAITMDMLYHTHIPLLVFRASDIANEYLF